MTVFRYGLLQVSREFPNFERMMKRLLSTLLLVLPLILAAGREIDPGDNATTMATTTPSGDNPEPAAAYGVVRLSVCNMRQTPDYDAEMVSQALLGTPVHILQVAEKNDWPEIQGPEGYTGWVHKAGIQILSKEEYSAWNAAEKVVVTALFGTVLSSPSRRAATGCPSAKAVSGGDDAAPIPSGVVSDVVGGDRLKYLGSKGRYWKVGFPDGRTGYLDKRFGERESVWRKKLDQSPEAILRTALSMNGFPYLWAGMSPKGMDCSGFVRTTLAMHDIIIPRDASQQAPKGERIELFPAAGSDAEKTGAGVSSAATSSAAAPATTPRLPDCSRLQPGDLLFFGRRGENGGKDRVSHVAIYLGDKQFIHSLGLVCIASMDPESPIYDAYNTGRLLFASRILPWINRQEGLTTTATNPFYNE
jgi:cell wall-associated NlpC family hydrolase/SH3-like domain-containing protein